MLVYYMGGNTADMWRMLVCILTVGILNFALSVF
jgi:hypothetical protein